MSATNVLNKLFCGVLALGLAFGATAAAAAGPDSYCPDCPPEVDGSIFPGGECTSCNPKDKDGSIFPGGSCVNCPTTKCVNCEQQKPAVQNYEVAYDDEIYKSVYRDCKNFAPITLEYVDFRIK